MCSSCTRLPCPACAHKQPRVHLLARARSCTLLHVLALVCTLSNALARFCMSLLASACSCVPMLTHVPSCTLLHALACSCTSLLARACSCTLWHALARMHTLWHALAHSCVHACSQAKLLPAPPRLGCRESAQPCRPPITAPQPHMGVFPPCSPGGHPCAPQCPCASPQAPGLEGSPWGGCSGAGVPGWAHPIEQGGCQDFGGVLLGEGGGPSECWRWQPSAWLPAPFGGPREAAQPPPPSRQLLAGIFRYRPILVLSASQMSPGAGVPSWPPPAGSCCQLSPRSPSRCRRGVGARSPRVPWGCPWGHEAPTRGHSSVSHHRVTTTGGSSSARHLRAPKHLGHGAKSH